MNKLLLVLVTWLTATQLSFSQDFRKDFANSYGSTDWETLAATIIDAEGNTYLCGSFKGTLQFGQISRTSNGRRDIYVAKMDKDGNVIWLHNYGGEYDENAYSILEYNGGIYLAGSFKKQTQIGSTQLQADGFTDAFIAKLDASGNVSTSNPPKLITSPAPAQKVFLQKGVGSDIVLAGTFKKGIEFDGQELLPDGKTDIYYVSYNAQNGFGTPHRIGGTEEDNLFDFKVSLEGDLYFACSFEGGLYELTSEGKSDALLLKINNASDIVMKKQYGGSYNDQLKQIALDASGNIYVAGEYQHAISIGADSYSTDYKKDVFIQKLDNEGNVLWQTNLGGEAYNTISSLELAANNKFYLTGSFKGTQATKKSAKNSTDAYIARYQTTDGTQEWLAQAGHNYEDQLQLKSYPTGELLVSCYFSNALELKNGNSSLVIDLKHKNYKDLLAGKLIDCASMPGIDLGEDTSACSSIELSVEDIYNSYTWSTGQTATNSVTITEPGSVTLQVTDAAGCTFEDEIQVTISNDISINLGNDTSFCEGASLLLTAGEPNQDYLWDDGSNGNEREITQSGTYWVQVNNQGCSGTDEITVTVNSLPTVDLGEDITVSSRTTYVLETAGVFEAYLWNTGLTESTLTIAGSSMIQTTAYSLTVTDANGCQNSDTILLVVGGSGRGVANTENQEETTETGESQEKTTTELENLENNNSEGYKVYPNPSSGKFFLSVADPEKVKQVDVFDLRGNKVKTFQNGFGFPLEIDLTGNAKGVYLIKVGEQETTRELRIILK